MDKFLRQYQTQKINNRYYLTPILESSDFHYIEVDGQQQAHEFKLSLGLGTYGDPIKAPGNYKLLKIKINNHPVYQIYKQRQESDEFDSGCCESGCPGCPWTLEQMKK